MFKKNLLAATVSVGLIAASGSASAFFLSLDNWGFDPDPGGAASLITPIDELTFFGLSYVDTDDVGGDGSVDGDSFTDVGRLVGTGFNNDFAPIFGTGLNVDYELTATFDIPGSFGTTVGGVTPFTFDSPGGGTFMPAGDALEIFIDTTLNAGTNDADLTVPSNPDGFFQRYNDGTSILTASLVEGNGNIDLGTVTGSPDGRIDIIFEVTAAAAGYWFVDLDLDGVAETDLSTIVAIPGAARFAVTDSNNEIADPSATADDNLNGIPDLVEEFVTNTGHGIPDANPTGDFYVTNDGSYTIAALVSEPETVALLGLALFAVGAVSARKRRA